VEDKIGSKKNSLYENTADQSQDNVEFFSQKIKIGKLSQVTDDFMIVARIESFILGKGLEDAVTRARAYIEAGADGILIHSKAKSPDEIFSFCAEYGKLATQVPLFVVPTTYNEVTEEELMREGVDVVIYANHLIRAAYPAMVKTATSILRHGRSAEADSMLMSIRDTIELIPGSR
jgi:phosphoenolpyruvate phosphomutase